MYMQENCLRTCGYRGFKEGFEKCYKNSSSQCFEDIDPDCNSITIEACFSTHNIFEYTKSMVK